MDASTSRKRKQTMPTAEESQTGRELMKPDTAYTEDQLSSWTTKETFDKEITPQIKTLNPGADSDSIKTLLSQMWTDFVKINPFLDEVSESDVESVHEIEASSEEKSEESYGKRRNKSKQKSSKGRTRKPVSRMGAVDVDSDFAEYSSSEDDSEASSKYRKTSGRATGKKTKQSSRTSTLKKKKKKEVEVESEAESIQNHEYCDECEQGGDLLLCDTCPRSFHLVCLVPELSEAPEGLWSCPECEKNGVTLPERPDPDGRLDPSGFLKGETNKSICYQCKVRGKFIEEFLPENNDPDALPPNVLLRCSSCHYSFHVYCQRRKNRPKSRKKANSYQCPLCLAEPPKWPTVGRIVTWRWDINEKDHEKTSPYRPREYLTGFKDRPYWDCCWLTDAQIEMYYKTGVTVYRNRNNMEVEPQLENGASIAKSKSGKVDSTISSVAKSTRRAELISNGIQSEWLNPDRVIAVREQSLPSGKTRSEYLIKWCDLGYDNCTWHPLREYEEIDFTPFIEEYNRRKALFTKMDKTKPGKTKKLNLPTYPKQPSFIAGDLYPYQLEGLNWIRYSYSKNINTILADEMGLGKTIQTIAFLYSLYKEGICNGPFLVSAPLSTIINWEREFEFWAPDFVVVNYTGYQDCRKIIRDYELNYDSTAPQAGLKVRKISSHVCFHVLLTSYEHIYGDKAALGSIPWEVLVVDEAHRLKNNQSLFFRVLNNYKINYRLLLTGTPLQNNLEELFYLLSFMEPTSFNDVQAFLDQFEDISKEAQVKHLHKMLAKHLLRRLKADVLVGMPSKTEQIVRVDLSHMQKKFYKNILIRNINDLQRKGSKTSQARPVSLINIMMDLRKCCNHPYLFPMGIDEAPRKPDDSLDGVALIKGSGKLQLLMRMLLQLKTEGHRVLLFSQMTRMLDLLEDFVEHLNYGYERIDGTVTGQLRQEAIDRFNSSESDSFIFLLSTKAGGLGINLATADTVIFYDSDWNPHNDIQAYSRSHRLGQKNKVMIYRFVTRNSVEEKMAETAKRKMMLTHLVVRPGMSAGSAASPKSGDLPAPVGPANASLTQTLTKKELDDILKFGTTELFKNDDGAVDRIVYDEAAVAKLLDRNQEAEVVPADHNPEADKEKEGCFNEYLSSFKVAHYEVMPEVNPDEAEKKKDAPVAEGSTEKTSDEAVGPGGSTAEKEVELDVNDPDYWSKVTGLTSEDVIEMEHVDLGKGKRIRRPVNYSLNKIHVSSDAATGAIDPDFLAEDISDLENDEEYMELSGKFAENLLPPRVSYSNDCLHIYGFNPRQRRSFLRAVMRHGLPTEIPNGPWLTRDICDKSDKELKAYTQMFMRHLTETPTSSKNIKYADGVPTEGLSRKYVLSRIAIMALIRSKVTEFEKTNINCIYEVMPANDPFTFDIQEGNLTELHQVWQLEGEHSKNSRSLRIWHSRHDYFLLAGILSHGYARWNEVLSDPRFRLLTNTLTNHTMLSKNVDVANQKSGHARFLSLRLRLLEQGLIVEEQLRRLAYLACLEQKNDLPECDADITSAEKVAVTGAEEGGEAPDSARVVKMFHRLEGMLRTQGTNKVVKAVENSKLYAGLLQLQDLLMDMKHDIKLLPSFITITPSSTTSPGFCDSPVHTTDSLDNPPVSVPSVVTTDSSTVAEKTSTAIEANTSEKTCEVQEEPSVSGGAVKTASASADGGDKAETPDNGSQTVEKNEETPTVSSDKEKESEVIHMEVDD